LAIRGSVSQQTTSIFSGYFWWFFYDDFILHQRLLMGMAKLAFCDNTLLWFYNVVVAF